MDEHQARRRRLNEPPLNAPPSSRYPIHDPTNTQGRSYGASGSERYRAAPLNPSPSTPRGLGATATYSSYYQEPASAFSTTIPQTAMPYQSEYGQDTRQTQGFGTYNTSMMYSVPQTSAHSSVYDANQQFPSRQPAAMQMMQTDVANPYFPSEPANTAAASSLQPHASSSSSSSVYQQSPATQRGMIHGYSSSEIAPTNSMAQPTVEEQEYPQTSEMGEAYEQYQTALREVFTNIKRGALSSASESLLNISDWLLSKVSELEDNSQLQSDRIKLWQDFNHAWLALFQKQKEMTVSGLQLQHGQSLMSVDGMVKMGKEIVRLCDGVDRHGLVDYQYGVWEESIIEIIEECLDVYASGQNSEPAGPSVANPAAASHRGHDHSR
ncbi:hypothetical protein GGR52DRAFT_574993 [Hypoxylon sp. FL1284]|nr:hypothetical protein GGR52DRAFT_574993 [Hypoxylon sp. FL1284]